MINYNQIEVKKYVENYTGGQGYDLVFDTVGGRCLDQSFLATKENGTVVSIAARSEHDLTPVHTKSLSLHVVFMLLPILHNENRESHGRILSKITALVENLKIRPLLHEQKFSFERGRRHTHAGSLVLRLVKLFLESNW